MKAGGKDLLVTYCIGWANDFNIPKLQYQEL